MLLMLFILAVLIFGVGAVLKTVAVMGLGVVILVVLLIAWATNRIE